ncbi:putative Multidrug resistance pump [Tripterygium wilfordii]|uniref:Putative Multidrug resistance pump n=1 Tax=Tripterygium wilfordii TaxID=458696 RepID=A0A7J7DRY5_TRIWF|nr:putative Multidrug resistance pump [Tripterygium wilfordii]
MDDEILPGSASKDKRCSWKEEILLEQKKIWRVGFPAMLARVTQYATILLPVFVFSSSIFKLIGEEDATADTAGYISLWFIPILYFVAINVTIQKYLQCQLKNMIVAWVSTASFVIHVFLSWIFSSKLNLGIPGAMTAMIVSTWLIVIGECVYIFGGWCPNTWEGFTFAAFSDLVPVLKLSISSGVMVCIEVWYHAVFVLLAGHLKNATTAISAFSICLNILIWELMACVSFLTASSVRVSNELGKGDAKAAKFSIKVILCTSLSVGVFFWALCLAFGRKIAFLFTNDKAVAEYVSSLSVLLAFSVLFNSSQTVFSGVAVGSGRQAMVAYVNIFCYYVIGVLVGVVLGWVAGLQVKGLWMGMILGVTSQSLLLAYITWRTDWEEQINKAKERLNHWLLKPSEESHESSAQERLN